MVNTLTGIVPILYEAMNVTSREMVGMIPAVRRDSTASRAALNQVVRSPIGVAGEIENIVPGPTPANTGGTTVGYIDIEINKSKTVPILWSGEEQLSVKDSINDVLVDQFADAMKKLTNAIEIDLVAAGLAASSRAYGTAGTTPFATAGNLTDIAQMRKILEDNGAPLSDLQIVFNSATIANLRGVQNTLFKVNEAGSSDMLRNGMTDRLQGFAVRNSAGLSLHTKGTGAGYLVNNGAGYAVNDTGIALDTGAGTVLAGDIVTFAGDTNKYVNNTALAGGSIVIGKPGLQNTLADNVAMTVGDSYSPNLAFAKSSIVLAARAPALVAGGDSADDRMTITDPISGLTFEVALYREYHRVKYEISMAWGVGVPNSAHIATLLG